MCYVGNWKAIHNKNHNVHQQLPPYAELNHWETSDMSDAQS